MYNMAHVFLGYSDNKATFIRGTKFVNYWNPFKYKFNLNKKYGLYFDKSSIISYCEWRNIKILDDNTDEYVEELKLKNEINYYSLGENRDDILEAFHNLKFGLFVTAKNMMDLQELDEHLLNNYGIEKWSYTELEDEEEDLDIHKLTLKDLDEIADDDDKISMLVDCYCHNCKKLLYAL